VILLARTIFNLNSISKLVLHAFVNNHLVYNFKFPITMDSTLSDIFRTNDELNTVAFEITRLGVVRYALTQPEGTEDWRRTTIFHTYIKCRDKRCKIIINNESCIDVVSRLGLKLVPHPKSYNVS
jgi:hypothetical protein